MNLFEVLANIDNPKEIEMILQDICTYKEIENMEQRLDSAVMLMTGDTYTQVTSKTKISSATLSRVSSCIQRGSGGYSKVLKRLIGSK